MTSLSNLNLTYLAYCFRKPKRKLIMKKWCKLLEPSHVGMLGYNTNRDGTIVTAGIQGFSACSCNLPCLRTCWRTKTSKPISVHFRRLWTNQGSILLGSTLRWPFAHVRVLYPENGEEQKLKYRHFLWPERAQTWKRSSQRPKTAQR